MKIKKYIAPTLPEAMKAIRKDLGPEAVILNSKEIQQGGFLGFFKKKQIEVVAGLDPEPITNHKKKQSLPIATSKSSKLNQDNTNENQKVLDEIKNLRKYVELQVKHGEESYSLEFSLVYQYLLDQELNKNIAKEIMDRVQKDLTGNTKDTTKIIQKVRTEIINVLEKSTYKGITFDKKIIQFVGPTGVGKTTTIAKVAANIMLKDKKKIAFITSDTYRIAAIDQLRTYSRILNVPLEVVYTAEDFQNAIHKFHDVDIILVDTAGRNFREEKYIAELSKNIDINSSIDTFLVLSLTAKSRDIDEIFDQFSPFSIKEVIFTKMDETRQYGSILNIVYNKKVGIGYLTNGQEVPNDIIRPTPELIANLLVGGYHDE